MECNKDDAIRAKEIAEVKLLEEDITGARKFALKAQNLYPSLDGLSKFIEVIDVYVSHDTKIYGETDYYGILGVDPRSSEDVLRKQYKRRALALHPDKNKSVGADGAFKILSQAWSILSDKDQKHVYDMELMHKRAAANVNSSFSSSNSMNTTPHVPTQATAPASHEKYGYAPQQHRNPHFVLIIPRPSNPAAHTTTAAFNNPQPSPSYQNVSATSTAPDFVFVTRPPSHNHHARPARNVQPTTRSFPPRIESFWICCLHCRVKYEHRKIFLNQILRCPLCHQPFLATEIRAPHVKRGRGRPRTSSQQHQAASNGFTSVPTSASTSRSAEGARPWTSSQQHQAASYGFTSAPATASASKSAEGACPWPFSQQQQAASYGFTGVPASASASRSAEGARPWTSSQQHQAASYGFTSAPASAAASRSAEGACPWPFSQQQQAASYGFTSVPASASASRSAEGARPWTSSQQHQAASYGFTSVPPSASASRTAEGSPNQLPSERLKRRHDEAVGMPMDNEEYQKERRRWSEM